MSRYTLVDRLQTIAATATVTSAVWIVVGTVYLGRGGEAQEFTEPAPASAAVAPEPGPPASSAERADLLIPVSGIPSEQLSDSFADARGGRRHEAIDILAPAGTPVIAAAAGTVEKLFRSDDGGNTIYVRSTDRRTIHYYAHLQDYAVGLAEGSGVRRGQRLGTVGSTGNADPAAPHLHFAILQTAPEARWYDNAIAINPYPLLGGT